jgi:hypothetical protein
MNLKSKYLIIQSIILIISLIQTILFFKFVQSKNFFITIISTSNSIKNIFDVLGRIFCRLIVLSKIIFSIDLNNQINRKVTSI